MAEIKKRFEELNKQAKQSGYFLNSDTELVMNLVEGLLENKKRYGEEVCPCRLVKGGIEDNLDIVCPCDYRDLDLAEHGSCFCGLYATEELLKQGGPKSQTPERRPPLEQRKSKAEKAPGLDTAALPYPVWRCKVCGYLCANTKAPLVCPVCKAKKERFERFL